MSFDYVESMPAFKHYKEGREELVLLAIDARLSQQYCTAREEGSTHGHCCGEGPGAAALTLLGNCRRRQLHTRHIGERIVRNGEANDGGSFSRYCQPSGGRRRPPTACVRLFDATIRRFIPLAMCL